jgi:hypothetical protein
MREEGNDDVGAGRTFLARYHDFGGQFVNRPPWRSVEQQKSMSVLHPEFLRQWRW